MAAARAAPREGALSVALGVDVSAHAPAPLAAFGVRWYWLIDPVKRTLEVLELGADLRYVRALAAADGRVTPPGCEGLVLDLDDLWREIDRLEDE